MTQGIESGVGDVWQVHQATLGTREPSTTTTTRRLRKTGRDSLKPAKTDGSEEYVDGAQWATPTPFVDTLGGDVGSLTFQGQIEAVAFAWASLLGVDVVTGSSDPYTHTISSSTATPTLQTIRQKAGAAIGPIRQCFYDAKIARLSQNNGRSQQVLQVQEAIMALQAAEVYSTDPTATDSGVDPLKWGEAVTQLNSVTLPEINGDTIDADSKLDVYRGQSAAPVCFIYNKGQITRTLSAIVTDGTLPQIQQVLYNGSSPADRTALTSQVITVPIVTTHTQSVRRTLTITTPAVEIDPRDWMLGPVDTGGAMEVAFGGPCHASGGSPVITIVALTGDSAAYTS